jgi:hypothetical protein
MPLTDAERSLVNQLRERLASYAQASMRLTRADQRLLQMLADELSAILHTHG